jgi:hypothetical protein
MGNTSQEKKEEASNTKGFPHIPGVIHLAKVTKFCPEFDMGSRDFSSMKSKTVTSPLFFPIEHPFPNPGR